MGLLVRPAGWTSWTDQLDRPAGRTSWTDQLSRPAEQTSWTDQLDRPAGRTSSFYLKPWQVRIFKDFPFSLYVVAASESDKGLVQNGPEFRHWYHYEGASPAPTCKVRHQKVRKSPTR